MATVPGPAAEDTEAIRRLSALSLSRNAFEYAFNIPHISELILPRCTPGTLVRLAQTCRTSHDVVQAYFASAFDINAHFRRFFDNPLDFRSLQARTGALVSGSNALQYFGRVVYGESDLDLYVKKEKVLEVGQWLNEHAGYGFEPNAHSQNQTQGVVFEEAVEDAHWTDDYGPIDSLEDVYNFYKQVQSDGGDGTRRKIQLIATLRSPMDTILHFHSTIVMNIISYDRAYSLYPYATFERRLGLQTPTYVPTHEREEDIFQKYRIRGWDFTHGPPELHVPLRDQEPQPQCNIEHPSSFYSQPRWIADRHSWVIRLPLNGVRIPAGKLGDPCYVSFWQLAPECKLFSRYQCTRRCNITVSFRIYAKPEFMHKYTIIGGKVKKILYHIRSMVRQLREGLPPLPFDHNDTLADDELFRACQSLLEERDIWKMWYPPDQQRFEAPLAAMKSHTQPRKRKKGVPADDEFVEMLGYW
ncbi:hypothetical protein BDW22DRAFT_1364557 [Trametopsis cervina]|nr:hypothetical protein BDW22DRAFT_1364557 [Trametopsis cervina]